ncbi:MAG: CapA family protein [Bacteroidales bacterium]|nr:CapA family protein [Lachnoclostridium sp.]MCM1385628.1 CapA family protein [Lachnoclostridium sp.]MCM1466274.1 CapA family protein [Bacteroidales bacterium]
MTKKKLVFGILLPLVIILVCVMIYLGISPSDIWRTAVDGAQKIASKEAWKENSGQGVSEFAGEKIETMPSEVPSEPVFEEYDITLMAVGDNLLHPGIIKTGIQSDGSYDFSFLFQNISDFLAKADIKVINQETIFGGNELGNQGYPKFNSPTQVGDAIVSAGFNIVLHATNHAADQGIEGILHCASYWEQHPEILMTGISKEETYSEIPLFRVGDISFAILNYTYGPNLGSVPASLRGHLNILCDYNEKTGALDFTKLHPSVLEDIKEAKTMADVVIVFPHWGTEYQSEPSKYQRKFAEEMTEAGADLIIGTHPHVPQPVEWIVAENGNKALCYYSLGNYVSLQKQAESMLEGMAWVTFHVTEDGVEIAEDRTGVLPMVCQYKQTSFRLENVYLLEEYTEEMAKRHGIQSYEEGVVIRLEDLKEQSQNTFGDMVLTGEDILASE